MINTNFQLNLGIHLLFSPRLAAAAGPGPYPPLTPETQSCLLFAQRGDLIRLPQLSVDSQILFRRWIYDDQHVQLQMTLDVLDESQR
jgi:hypothetical protein